MKTRYLLWAVSLMLLCIFPASESFSQYDPGEPDTVRFGEWIVDVTGPPYQGTAFVPVLLFNDESVSKINIPLGWTGPLSCDSGKFVGERPEYFMSSNVYFSNDEKWVVGSGIGEDPFIPPGDGDFLYLYFSVLDTGFVSIDSTSMFGWLYLSLYDTLGLPFIP